MFAVGLALTGALPGCAGRGADGAADTGPEDVPHRPLEMYRRQGLIAGTEDFPAVGSFAFVAGPGDSTWVLFGLSLPAAALRFHRDGPGFEAGYSVALRFRRGGAEHVSRHSQRVRVATFEETARTAESIFYQDFVLLEPGRYVVELEVADSIGRGRLEAVDTIDAPGYDGAAPPPALLLVHEVTGQRSARHAPPPVVLNSRRAVAFASDPPRVYAEAYGPGSGALELRVLDAAGVALLTMPVPVAAAADASFRSGHVTLPMDSLPLGVLTLTLRDPAAAGASTTATLLVTISDDWMVANYDELLDYLAHIASSDELELLRDADGPAARRAAWDAFWSRRDPEPATAANEFREEFFARVRAAAEQFAETGRPGWRSERGEVYIVLGPPDRVSHGELDVRGRADALSAIEWSYDRASRGRITLIFVDRDGFGRYELTRDSRLTFRAVSSRMRPPAD